MNLKNFLKTLLMLIVFTALVNTSAFAANWYVSNTNGNDVVGTGTALQPYKSIAKALSVAADGDYIYIDADTYNEANVNVTVAVHFVAQTFNALNVVTITNGMTINDPSKTVYLGASADGSQQFNLGTGATALVLTAGNLNVTGSNVTIGSGGTVTVTAGTLSEALTTTNVNVVYNGTTDINAGPELPASLGTGTLTVGITAGKTLTAGSAVSFSNAGNIVVNTGNVTFNAGLTFNYSAATNAAVITNNGVGNTVTFNGAVSLNRSAGTSSVTFDNNNTGTLAFVGGITNNSSSNITLGLNNTSTGTVQLGASTINGTIANNTGGTIELLGAVTFSGTTIGNGNAASVFKLNAYQLTLSNAAALTNTGNIISATAATVGNGMLNITGAVTLTGGGELPNVTVNGQLVVPSATVPVYGTFTLASSTANALDFGAAGTGVLEIWGSSFSRTDNTPTNVRAGNGTLSFRGGLAQNFTPGASLTLYNLLLNKTASTTVTLTASVEVANNLTLTAGQLNVGDYNLNLTGAASVFDNGGNAYSSTGNGYVVFSGATPSIQGGGVFGNILVSVGTGNTLTAASNVTMSGVLYIYSGSFNVPLGNTADFTNDLVANPTIKVNTTTGNGAAFTSAGTVTYSANVNLYYLGANDFTAGAEWTGAPTKINDVTIATDGGTTVTGVNAASTIAGTLTVNGNTTLAQGANTYTLSGDNKTHMITGTVTGGTLLVTGSGSAVNGTTSTTTGYNASVNNLDFEPAANGATFTSTDLKTIGGNLILVGTSTKTGSSVTITMNAKTSTLTGNLAVGAGAATTASVTINGTTTSVLTGNVTLTAGSLTLTRGGNSTVIGGGVTLTAGTLTLGSNVSVAGATAQAAGNIDAGGFTYTQLGGVNYVRTGTGTFTNGTLSLNSTAGNITLTPGTSFSVPNLSSVGTANGVTVGASMEVTNSLTLDNAGTFTQAGTLTVSGSTVTVTNDAGAFTGALTLSGAPATATFAQSYTIPTLTINSTDTVTIASSSSTARTITVNAAFTNTAGTLATGINNLTIANPGTFTFTAGAITQGSGILTWNTAGAVTLPASGFSIDNLTVSTDVNVGTSAFMVNKNLVMNASVTTSADGKLSLGDGCMITRTANAAVLNKVPTFGATTNVTYSTYTGAVDINTGNELPATVNNLTVVAGANHVVLTASVTVNGTLSLAGMLDATTNSKTVTMADGSTLELKVNGTAALDKNLVKAGTMALVYNGAAATSTRELGALVSGAYPTYTGSITVKNTQVALAAPLTTSGTVTFDGAGFNLAGNALTLMNDFSTTSNGGAFTNTGATANLNLAGTMSTMFGLNTTWQVPASIKFTINKSAASDSLSLTGGNLDFATNAATLYLTQGVIVTGSNIVILPQGNNGLGQPTQGFVKTGVSYVIGNVQKYINRANTIDISYVQFPVGTPDGNYRLLDYYFKTAPQSSINLTVSAAAVSPGGDNGFPITTPDGLHLTNYAPFYWYVKSDIPLAPSYKYDMDAQAQGYTGYLADQIQNVRFVRRDSGNVNNQWILQGGTSYDNSTVATNWPVVKVIDATGGITTQGSIFAYSQLNKPPVFTSAPKDTTLNGGDTLNVTVKATDPDLNQTVTLSLPTAPSWLSLDASTGKLSGAIPNKAATYNVTVRATDNLGATTDTTFAITVKYVNTPPQFAAQLANTNVKTDSTFTYQYQITDPDSGQTHTFWFGGSVPSFATLSSTGMLTIQPTFADLDSVFTFFVNVTDGIDTVASANTKITVISGTKKGDVSGSGGPDPAGASLVLKYAVGDTSVHLTAQQLYAADVDGNGVINAFDAANILYAYAHHDSLIGGGVLMKQAARGTIAFGKLSSEPNTNIVVLPVSLANSANVYSASIKLNVGKDLASIQSVNGSLPQGWVMSHFYSNGVLKIAMAGTTPLTDGNIAEISFNLKNKDTHLEINGSAELNANVNAELGSVTVKQIPNKFALSQNYPNPFNPSTTIKYQLAKSAKVTLEIYDILGQRVRTLVSEVQDAGYYKIIWDGSNNFGQKVSSGIYIYRLQAGSFVQTLKMNLLK